MRRKSTSTFVDGTLLAKAASHDRQAIATICANAADHVETGLGLNAQSRDDLALFVVNALRAIGSGKSPDEAFGWKRGRGNPPSNSSMLHWTMARYVHDLVSAGHSLDDAAAIVASAWGTPAAGDVGGTVRKAYTRYRDLPLPPDDIFPLTPKVMASIRCLDDEMKRYFPDPKN
jgi:hypothetical protein